MGNPAPSVMLLDVPAERLLPGVRLRHHAASEWIVVKDLGGPQGDYLIECIDRTDLGRSGEQIGTQRVVHGEYVPRSFKVVLRIDFVPVVSGGGDSQ
jgi:hypothetical protein